MNTTTNISTELEHVPRQTFFWIMGAVVTAHVTVLGGVFAILNDRIDRVESRIDVVDDRVDSINTDIRSILVGIEQVKARLGIIENETGTRFSQ